MGGFFGTIKKESCVTDLFYGVDYNSHLGTKRAGIVTYENGVFKRAIHNIENSYFRSKFEAELPEFSGNSGIGVISDTDAQPIIISCHLGKFAIVTVAKINNVEELEKELLASGNHFSEHSNNIINPIRIGFDDYQSRKRLCRRHPLGTGKNQRVLFHAFTHRARHYRRSRQIRSFAYPRSDGEITATPYRPKHAASRTSDTNSVTTYVPEKSSG